MDKKNLLQTSRWPCSHLPMLVSERVSPLDWRLWAWGMLAGGYIPRAIHWQVKKKTIITTQSELLVVMNERKRSVCPPWLSQLSLRPSWARGGRIYIPVAADTSVGLCLHGMSVFDSGSLLRLYVRMSYIMFKADKTVVTCSTRFKTP